MVYNACDNTGRYKPQGNIQMKNIDVPWEHIWMEGVHVWPGYMSHKRDMLLNIYVYKEDILRIEISYITYRNKLYYV